MIIRQQLLMKEVANNLCLALSQKILFSHSNNEFIIEKSLNLKDKEITL